MGLIHSRASKKRAKEQARLAKEQAKLVKEQRKQLSAQGGQARAQAQQENLAARTEAAGDNPWRQPTLGGAIRTWQRNRDQR